jgi:hypothetical protein
MERRDARLPRDVLADDDELVFSIGPLSTWSKVDRFWYAWDEAQVEAEQAYEAWCGEPGRHAYVVYRAAQDRADAAQDALARCSDSAAAIRKA